MKNQRGIVGILLLVVAVLLVIGAVVVRAYRIRQQQGAQSQCHAVLQGGPVCPSR